MYLRFIEAIMNIFRNRKLFPAIDLTFLPPNKDKIKGVRDESKVNIVVAHVTAVEGGFGPGSDRMKKWQRLLDNDEVRPALLMQLESFPPGEHAKLLSLWERYSKLPYHWLTCQAVKPHIIHNLFPSVYSYHAGIGNKHSVGWAIDCQHDEALSRDFIKAGRESLRRCIEEVRNVCDGDVYVQAHRNYSNMRDNDPGATVWSSIVVPVVNEISYAKIDYALAEGSGKTIPESWAGTRLK